MGKTGKILIGVVLGIAIILGGVYFHMQDLKDAAKRHGQESTSSSTSTSTPLPESSSEASGAEPSGASSEEGASSSESAASESGSSEAGSSAAGSSETGSSETLPPEPKRVTLTFTGDCTLGTDEEFGYYGSFMDYYDTYGPDWFFEKVRPIFQADDITVINMEGVFTNEPDRVPGKAFCFKAPPEAIDIVKNSYIETANLANNHAFDFGEKSHPDTIAAYEEAGIPTFGYDEVLIIEKNGLKVGFSGINGIEVYAGQTEQIPRLTANIEKLKEQGADIIIAVMHWGWEYETAPSWEQFELGHLAIDLGADAVIGHHPHILQGIETYKGKPICFSLGNFCFGGNFNPREHNTMLVQLDFEVTEDESGEGVQTLKDWQMKIIPCRITTAEGYNNYQPTPVEGELAEDVMRVLTERSGEIIDSLLYSGYSLDDIEIFNGEDGSFSPAQEE